jgi:ElaB/YqjD/DUF883 family membrane-anchored ribosome-binding protein
MQTTMTTEHMENPFEQKVTREKFMNDLRTLGEDVRQVFLSGCDRLGAKWSDTKERVGSSYQKLEEKASQGSEKMKEQVRSHPYRTFGIACLAGIALASLFTTRRGSKSESCC